ncbi:MAG: hypothetical protein M1822_008844 [Bathelium mastoideum]|nr:MAG: hypothetical protein M1822_008844 [Bathelium mastoideum]
MRAIMFVAGTNSDCRDDRWESADAIRKDIRDLLEHIAEKYSNVFILLNTPPPIQYDLEYKTVTQNGQENTILWREQRRIAEIANVFREFRGPNVGICDLYEALLERRSHWYIDSVHLSEAAEEVWAKLAIEELAVRGIMR